MDAEEPASGGVHDSKWTAAEIAEWKQKMAQVTRRTPQHQKRVADIDAYDTRGLPEAMDFATASNLAGLVAHVEERGGHPSSVLVAEDGANKFTDIQLNFQFEMFGTMRP